MRSSAPSLCPGHRGGTPCSDGGRCAKRKNGRHRSHCEQHFPFLAREQRILKTIRLFFEESGVDLSAGGGMSVAQRPNPPPRKVLKRPVRPRATPPGQQDLQKKIDNLQHKLDDTRQDYERAKAQRGDTLAKGPKSDCRVPNQSRRTRGHIRASRRGRSRERCIF